LISIQKNIEQKDFSYQLALNNLSDLSPKEYNEMLTFNAKRDLKIPKHLKNRKVKQSKNKIDFDKLSKFMRNLRIQEEIAWRKKKRKRN